MTGDGDGVESQTADMESRGVPEQRASAPPGAQQWQWEGAELRCSVGRERQRVGREEEGWMRGHGAGLLEWGSEVEGVERASEKVPSRLQVR